jgi:hypothetical protein
VSDKPEPRDGVIDSYFDDANALLDALAPRSARWSPGTRRWAFRGQADANWALLPKAFRRTPEFPTFDSLFASYGVTEPLLTPGVETPRFAGLFRRLMQDFIIGLHSRGYPVPQDIGVPQMLGLAHEALAQHHGLPTSLLDWTYHPRVASFFAAKDASAQLKKGARSQWLAVWALAIEDMFVDSHLTPQVRAYIAPASTNPNLHAQEGLFVHFPRHSKNGLEYLLSDFNATQRKDAAPVALNRLVLPCSEAPQLLRLLYSERIHSASLFPGVDSIVEGLRERGLWDRPPT